MIMPFLTPPFVTQLARTDPPMFRLLQDTIDLAMQPGALDGKTKLLIALALDAFKGSEAGVRALAGQARDEGAAEDEIREALRIAYVISAMECLKAGAAAQIPENIDPTG